MELKYLVYRLTIKRQCCIRRRHTSMRSPIHAFWWHTVQVHKTIPWFIVLILKFYYKYA